MKTRSKPLERNQRISQEGAKRWKGTRELQKKEQSVRKRLQSPRRADARGRWRRDRDRTLRSRAISTGLDEALSKQKKPCVTGVLCLPRGFVCSILLSPGQFEAPHMTQLYSIAAGGGRSLRPLGGRGTQNDLLKPVVGLGGFYLNISGPRNLDPGCKGATESPVR